MVQDPELPIEDEKVDTTPNAPIETPTPSTAGDDQEPQSDQPAKPRRGRAKSTVASTESADNSADASPDQGESTGDTEEHPSPSEQAEAAKDEAPTALSSIAQQIIRDHGLDIVFMTSDGTAFFTFNDATNYGRNLVDPDVSYYTRPGLSADELKTIIPDHLQEKTANE